MKARRRISPDTETHPIAPGYAAPRQICTSWYDGKFNGLVHKKYAKKLWRKWLEDPNVELSNNTMHFDMASVAATWPDLTDLIFAAYEASRIRCNVVDQRLIDISNGKLKKKGYSVAGQMKRHFDVERNKGEDTWRVHYNQLEHITDIEEWPEEASGYAKRDAVNAYMCTTVHDESAHLLRDNYRQAYASFALYLMSCRGIRTDRKKCLALIKATKYELQRCYQVCIENGLLDPDTGKKSRKNAQQRLVSQLPKDTRKRLEDTVLKIKAYNAKREKQARNQVQISYGLDDKEFKSAWRKLDKLVAKDIDHEELLRRWERAGWSKGLYREMMGLVRKPRPFSALGVSLTKTGQVSVNANACRLAKDPVLQAFATHTSANSLLKKAQRMLRGADIPLQTTYESPIATGRVSSRASDLPLIGDNFMNFRRGATQLEKETHIELPGQRECIIPREGFTFCSIDLDSAEMRAYAQLEFLLFGESEMGRTLNAGQNPHRALGADILGMSYKKFERLYAAGDPACVNAAQFAKIPNFALLGGGGWRILPDYARGMGITIDDSFAQELYDAFHSKWRTVKDAHKEFKHFIHKRYEHPFSKRLRYIDRYAQACNNPFQGLIADAAKWAVCQLAREEYTSGGCLRGSYSVLFMHDEVIFELVNKWRSEHAWRATRIMIDSVNEYLPDVPMTAKPALSMYLAKGAKTVTHETKKDRDGNPLLLVWEEKKAA